MRSFKMKDLMIRIQPEAWDKSAYGAKIFNDDLPPEYHFGTCISPSSCGCPSTCSSAQSCKPTVCPDKPGKPKPKHHEDEFSGDVMELADLKNMLAEMQIKMSRRSSEVAELH
jgi:hypothetical protein